MIRKISFLSTFVLLAACSTTYPVAGVVEGTGEKFLGTATSTASVSTFDVTSDKGASCAGTYKATVVFDSATGATTKGSGTCSDGRSFTWATTGTVVGGQGFGSVGGNRLRIYYGQFASNQQLF